MYHFLFVSLCLRILHQVSCWGTTCACDMVFIMSFKPEGFMLCFSCAGRVDPDFALSSSPVCCRRVALLSMPVAHFLVQFIHACLCFIVLSVQLFEVLRAVRPLQSGRCCPNSVHGVAMSDDPLPLLHLSNKAHCDRG